MATQKGVLLKAGGRATSIEVPCPPADRNKIDPATYAAVLAHADPQHLLLADVPFSGLVGHALVLVFDASSEGERAANPCASRLTTALADGLEVQVRGDALAFYATPGINFGVAQWEELDNCITTELASFYKKGQRPSEDELAQLVLDFHQGQFNYGAQEGEEDEDANKDDGGKELRDALPRRGGPLGGEAAAGMPRPPSGVDWRPLVGEGHPGVV